MGINEIIQVGNQIKEIRKLQGFTQKEIATRAGIPYTTYSNYENNNREPNYEQLRKITSALNVPLSVLIENNALSRNYRSRLREYNDIKKNTSYSTEYKQQILDEYASELEKIKKELEFEDKQREEAAKNAPKFFFYDKKGNKVESKNGEVPKWTDRSVSKAEAFASSEEEFNKLQIERQIELEKKNLNNIHKYDATIEVTPEAMERLKEDAEAREILKKYEAGEKVLDSEYKKVIEYHNRMMERSKLLQKWLEWYKSTCEPLNDEGRKKVAEYAGTLAETDKYTKPKEWFQGRMTKEEIEKAIEAYLDDDNSHESNPNQPEPTQE